MSSLRRLTTVSRPRMLRFPALTMPIPAIRAAAMRHPAARTAVAPAMAPANRGVIPAPEVIRAQAAVPAVTLGPATRLTAPTEPPANKRMQSIIGSPPAMRRASSLWWVKTRPFRLGQEGLVLLSGCHWGYGRKSLAEWRALLWGVRYGGALRCWSLAGKAVLRQTKYGGVGQRVMVPSAVWACASRGWQRSKNRATCWGQRPM